MAFPSSRFIPAAIAVASVVAVQLVAQLLQIGYPVQGAQYRCADPVPPMSRAQADLSILLNAADAYGKGNIPYGEAEQIARSRDPWGRTPPYPPALYRLILPLARLPGSTASHLWLFAFPFLFCSALLVLLFRGFPSLKPERLGHALAALLCFGLSASMLLQWERGNYDWVVLGLYLMAMLLLMRRRDLLAGAVLGLCIALKLYPIIFLPILLVLRRFKALGAALASLAVVILVTGPAGYLEWIQGPLGERSQWMEVRAWNTTIANLVGAWFPRMGDAWAIRTGLVLYACSFAALLLVLARREWRGWRFEPGRVGLAVIPWMFLIPSTSMSYTLFGLIPLLFPLAEAWGERQKDRGLLSAQALFIGVCQAPIVALALRKRSWGEGVFPAYSLCLIGLAVVAIALLARGCWAERALAANQAGTHSRQV